MVYYDGKVLGDNFFTKRKEERQKNIINGLSELLVNNPSGVSTNQLWYYLVRSNSFLFDYRTLHKDLTLLEGDGLLVSSVFFGGKGVGTKKFWNLPLNKKTKKIQGE